jgi:hypothetical protein
MPVRRRRLLLFVIALVLVAGAVYVTVASRMRVAAEADAASRGTPSSRPATTAPLELEPGPGRNLLVRPIPLTTINQEMVDQIGGAKRFWIGAGTDSYDRVVFAPRQSFARFDLRLRFFFAPIEPEKEATFARLMTVGLFDRDKPMPGDIVYNGMPGGFFGVALWADRGGRVSVIHGPDATEVLNQPIRGVSMDLAEPVVIRMVRDRGRDEVFVNGDKIYAAPSAAGGPTPAMPGVYIKAVGTRLNHARLVMTEPPTVAGDVASATPRRLDWFDGHF